MPRAASPTKVLPGAIIPIVEDAALGVPPFLPTAANFLKMNKKSHSIATIECYTICC